MCPKIISEVIDGIANSSLKEGLHVEFKVYHDSVKIEDLARSMVGIANSGGGVIVLGVGEMTLLRLKNSSYIFSGTPVDTKRALNKDLRDFINSRVANLEDWNVEFGNFDAMDIAAVFVRPSRHGMVYVYSASDKANRTYYYRKGADVLSFRYQFRTIYKYMTIETFINSLENKSWRFWEPRKWSDKFESRFYCANYDRLDVEPGSIQRVYATCLTLNKNSEAAWKVYAGKEGMQMHCVQLELDSAKLLDQLFKSDCKIYERRMDYKDEYFIMNIHETSNKNHAEYFGDFDLNLYLNLLALKRDAYTYENEVRYFAIEQSLESRSRGKMNPYHKDLKMRWDDVIKSIRVDKNCSDSELIALRYSCWSCGIDPVFKGRALPGTTPTWASSLKPVDVILFNIDDMPGRKSIEIGPVL